MKKIKKKILLITSLVIISSIFILPNMPHQKYVEAATTSNILKPRIMGNNRYDTSVNIANAGWSNTSDYAIIATGEDFPDALCATPLAQKYDAPILLTNTDSLYTGTKEELQKLKVKTAIIVGGTGAVSESTENEIQALGIQITRIAGKNRYETSEKIAEKMGKSNEVVVTTGLNFPDALSIAPIAAAKGIPILLTGMNALADEIKPYITNNTFTNSYVIGGDDVVDNTVFSALQNPKRLSGNNRYDTNITILNEFKNDLNLSNVYIVTDRDFPDGLVCSALAASTSSPMILIDNAPEDSTVEYIINNYNSFNSIVPVGGTGAMPEDLVQATATGFGQFQNNISPPATTNPIVNYAYTFLGTPYLWGGNTPSGFDCSGFMQYVYAHFGMQITRTTYTQINQGVPVSKDQLKPGDLIFFGTYDDPHHVGMYVGRYSYIHSPHTGDVIKISSLYGTDYLCARRIVQ